MLEHKPVLVNQISSYFSGLKEYSTIVDCTSGRGGHLDLFINLNKKYKIIAIDKDSSNIEYLNKKYNINKSGFIEYKGSFIRTVHSDYKFIKDIIGFFDISKVDGVLMDLGFSSPQIEDPNRGFSFMYDSDLDMRYDQNNDIKAKDIVNSYSYQDLVKIFKDYGEESFSKNISKNIIKSREEKSINKTYELVDIIKKSIPKRYYINSKINPATKVFQALRIETNKELESLKYALTQIPFLLNPNGIVSVISFHSIEDRIVKTMLNNFTEKCVCPKKLPICTCGSNNNILEKINNKPIIPNQNEIDQNPRSRSSKLRLYKKVKI